MEKINSISDLINILSAEKGDNGQYLSHLRRLSIAREEYENYISWDANRYTRNVIFKDDNFELILVCFDNGQLSPIHDYDAQNAWITVLEGKLREEKFIYPKRGGALEKVSSVNLAMGDFSFITGSVGIHRYYNIFGSRSIGLCLFSKPVYHWKVFDEGNGKNEVESTWYNYK